VEVQGLADIEDPVVNERATEVRESSSGFAAGPLNRNARRERRTK